VAEVGAAMVGASGTVVVTAEGANNVRSAMNNPTAPMTAMTTTAIPIFFNMMCLSL
jgi:hypothetical protein